MNLATIGTGRTQEGVAQYGRMPGGARTAPAQRKGRKAHFPTRIIFRFLFYNFYPHPCGSSPCHPYGFSRCKRKIYDPVALERPAVIDAHDNRLPFARFVTFTMVPKEARGGGVNLCMSNRSPLEVCGR